MLVEDLMTRQPPVCYRGQPAIAAVRLMLDHDLDGVPVVDRHSNLVGLLSADDLMRWEAQRNTSRRWTRTLERPVLVAHVMNHEAIAVSTTESVPDAARVMQYIARSVIPVLDTDGALAGLISSKDIAAASIRSDDSIRREVQTRLRLVDSTTIAAATDVRVEDGIVTVTRVGGSRRDQQAALRAIATVVGISGIRAEPLAGADAGRVLGGEG